MLYMTELAFLMLMYLVRYRQVDCRAELSRHQNLHYLNLYQWRHYRQQSQRYSNMPGAVAISIGGRIADCAVQHIGYAKKAHHMMRFFVWEVFIP